MQREKKVNLPTVGTIKVYVCDLATVIILSKWSIKQLVSGTKYFGRISR